jgi:hypothetical protein
MTVSVALLKTYHAKNMLCAHTHPVLFITERSLFKVQHGFIVFWLRTKPNGLI